MTGPAQRDGASRRSRRRLRARLPDRTTRRRWLSLLPLLIALPWPAQEASAAEQIYRSVDERGHLIFSDRPCPEARELELRQPNVMQSPDQGPAYTHIAFGTPGPGSVVPAGGADQFELHLDMEPRLRAGHRVQLVVDGAAVGRPTTSCIFTIRSINAGSHRFEARVLGPAGEEIGRSAPLALEVSRTLRGSDRPPQPEAAPGTACFAPSDSMRAGVPMYELPQSRVLNRQEEEDLRALFRKTGLNWKGTGIRTTCREDAGQPVAQTQTLNVEADFTQHGDRLRLRFATRLAGAGTRGSDTIELVLADHVLTLGEIGIELQELSATTLAFSTKYRLAAAPDHRGLWREVERRIELRGSAITVDQHFYTEGRLTSTERWDLTR
jgi:hypothetical protein